jgi:tight adherence protein B
MSSGGRSSGETSFEAVAVLVERLAVLTGAGIPPLPAWRYAADDGAPRAAIHVSEARSADEVPERLAEIAREAEPAVRSAWAALAATWWIATDAGAALSTTLARCALVLRGLEQGARDVEVALAGPTATSRVVLALPAVGLALGLVLGFDVAGALVSVPGAICLGTGGILIFGAVRWNRRLLRAARDVDATPGLAFELIAVALAGGASLARARQLVETACLETGLDPPGDAVDAVLGFAQKAGVPASVLLRSEADERRRASRALAARSAAELETRLLLPLGLCVLPAFVLIGVVPIALAIVSSTAIMT